MIKEGQRAGDIGRAEPADAVGARQKGIALSGAQPPRSKPQCCLSRAGLSANVLGRSRNHVAAGSPRKSPIAVSNMIRRDMALYPTIHIPKYRSGYSTHNRI